ncbi:MAG: hypothetical protein IOC86_03230 [Aestuariivirga sp.]|nr:hypothetical protein [Aestuariivirga sp.]
MAALLQFSPASAQNEAPAPAPAPAQQPAPAGVPSPVQLSDQQINLIVNAVTGAVLSQMKASEPKAAPAAPAAAQTTVRSAEEGISSYLHQMQTELVEKLGITLSAFPALGEHVSSVLPRVDGGPRGLNLLEFFGYMAMVFAVGAALGYGASILARRLLPGSEPKAGPASVGQTLRRALASLIGLALFLALTSYVSSTFAHGMGTQGTVAQLILSSGQRFAVFFTLFLIWFRPSEPAYRIVPLDGADAKLVMRLFVVMRP